MASNSTFRNWSVRIIGIPVSVTSTQLTKTLSLHSQYRVVIPKVQNYNNNTQYAWVNNFDNEEKAKQFANQWSGSLVFGEIIKCFPSAPNETQETGDNFEPTTASTAFASPSTNRRSSMIEYEDDESSKETPPRLSQTYSSNRSQSPLQQYHTSDRRFQHVPEDTLVSQSTFDNSTTETEEWHVKIIGLPQHISKRDLAAILKLPIKDIVIPIDQDHSYWFAWLNNFPNQQKAMEFANKWRDACIEPNSEVRIKCQVHPPRVMNNANISGRSSPESDTFLQVAEFDEPVADQFREKMLQEQTESKLYYDSFPNIDDTTNETRPDIKKAEELTKSILNKAPSGDPSERDTLCHILNKLLSNQDQQCLFYDSTNGTNLHDAAANLADLSSEDKPFVLKLKSSQGLGGDKNSKTDNDDLKLVQTLNNCIENNKSHPIIDDIRDRLAKAHKIDKNNIVVKSLYVGTFNIVYTILDLTAAVVQKLKDASRRLKNQFSQFVSAKIHPLLYRPTFDISHFDARGNKTFGSQSETHQVGPPGRTKTYTTAAGWTRYGLKVLGAYNNDDWLHPFGHAGNWYRAFHGTGSAQKVDFGGFNTSNFTPAPCVDALASIYITGFRTARVAAYGPGVYCSPNPGWLQNSGFVGAVKIDTKNGIKNFKCMFQVAVNPDDVKCATNDIWVVPDPKNIRPYGILIQEA